jgi:flagellar biosynthetic protein FliO
LLAVFTPDNDPLNQTLSDSASALSANKLDSLSYNLLYKEADTPLKPLETPSFSSMLIKMILSLILITIILYIALRVMKKLNQGNSQFFNKNMKVIDTLNIGFKQSVYIVQILEKYYLFSVSANGVSLIEKITDPDQIESLKNTSTIQNDSFDKILNKFKIKKKVN